jgi:uncharacterized cupin superfamily protein
MPVEVEKPSAETISEMQGWSKEVSVFDWEHDATETCYVLEGEVKVTTSEGETIAFGAGDLVTFPRGLKCTWEVRKPIRKHYRFT